MVSAAKAFSKEPPREPLTSLRAIHEDFIWRYQDRDKTDQVIKFCADAPDFPTAVRRAVEARDERNKHHNHQSKVDITARRKFGAKIIKRADRGSLDLVDFDNLHARLDKIKPYGIGPVTVYDVSIRIAAFLGIEPNSVYLHAGVRQGLKAMVHAFMRVEDGAWGNIAELHTYLRRDRVPLYVFPDVWAGLKADDIEDMLCTYREVFESW